MLHVTHKLTLSEYAVHAGIAVTESLNPLQGAFYQIHCRALEHFTPNISRHRSILRILQSITALHQKYVDIERKEASFSLHTCDGFVGNIRDTLL